MKIILFNCGLTVFVDNIDIDLMWNHTWRSDSSGYLHTFEGVPGTYKDVYLHKLIADRMKLEGPTIDHKDRDPLNNCRINLRSATQTQQVANRDKMINNTSGYIGVEKRGNKYISKVQGKIIGTFVTKEEAAKRRDWWAVKIYGDFAVLNFPK